MKLIEIRALGGVNYIRPDKVVALQTTPTGTTVIVMEGGAMVQCSEKPADVAKRLLGEAQPQQG